MSVNLLLKITLLIIYALVASITTLSCGIIIHAKWVNRNISWMEILQKIQNSIYFGFKLIFNFIYLNADKIGFFLLAAGTTTYCIHQNVISNLSEIPPLPPAPVGKDCQELFDKWLDAYFEYSDKYYGTNFNSTAEERILAQNLAREAELRELEAPIKLIPELTTKQSYFALCLFVGVAIIVVCAGGHAYLNLPQG